MKINRKYQIMAVVVSATLLLSSCAKTLLDINTNPNTPSASSLTAGLVLPNALNATASLYDNVTAGNNNFAFVGIWFGTISFSGNYAIGSTDLSYTLTNSYGTGSWYTLYDNNNDYQFIEQQGVSTNNPFYTAIGKLMKAYNYETLVDLYGDVPYTQALKGTAAGTPVYDKQQDVYKALGVQMDSAISLFGKSVDGSITGDIMFNGDHTKWLALANTLKLRFLVQQSANAGLKPYVTTEFAKFSASTTFISTDAMINPPYQTAYGKQAPIWGSNYNASGVYSQDFYRGGGYAIKFMQTHNDSLRLKAIYSLPSSAKNTYASSYAGNFLGQNNPLVNSGTSGFGTGILKSPTQGAIFMLAAESNFLQAEAIVRGFMTGSAQTLYQNGVQASFNYLLGSSAATTAAATAYYSQPGDNQVNFAAATTTSAQLALLSRQMLLAEDMINELEFYNMWRRTGYPSDVPLSQYSASTGQIPVRLLYPQSEINSNTTNVPTGVTGTTKIFWMP